MGVDRCQFWSAASRRAPCLARGQRLLVYCLNNSYERIPCNDDDRRLLVRHGERRLRATALCM